jgi:hypothetical protein
MRTGGGWVGGGGMRGRPGPARGLRRPRPRDGRPRDPSQDHARGLFAVQVTPVTAGRRVSLTRASRVRDTQEKGISRVTGCGGGLLAVHGRCHATVVGLRPCNLRHGTRELQEPSEGQLAELVEREVGHPHGPSAMPATSRRIGPGSGPPARDPVPPARGPENSRTSPL